MICLLSSNTEIPVPSKVTRDGSFCDLNLKKTEDDMVAFFCELISLWIEVLMLPILSVTKYKQVLSGGKIESSIFRLPLMSDGENEVGLRPLFSQTSSNGKKAVTVGLSVSDTVSVVDPVIPIHKRYTRSRSPLFKFSSLLFLPLKCEVYL
jgi:hypothetical protein